MYNKIQNTLFAVFALTMFFGTSFVESTTYNWQYYNQGLDSDGEYQTLLEPPFGLKNEQMSGDLNHFYNWSDVGYVFGFYGHPHVGDTALFSEHGQPNVYYRVDETGPNFSPDLITFDQKAQKYNITIMDNLSFQNPSSRSSSIWNWPLSNPAGIKNESSHQQTVNIVNKSQLEFKGEASALVDGSREKVAYNVGNQENGAQLIFRDNSSSGGAEINLTNGSQLLFFDNAKAENSNITLKNGSTATFKGISTPERSNLSMDRSTLISDHDITLKTISTDKASQIKMAGKLSLGDQNNQEVLASITDFNAPATVVKQGNGTLTLGGNSTYTGGTFLNEGTLKISDNSNLGNQKAALTMGDKTILKVSQDAALNRTIHLKEGAQSIDTEASSVAISGNIQGNGKLIKTGSGKLTLLSPENSYKGGTLVSQGTLEGNHESLKGVLENNSTVNFNQTSSGNFQGNLKGKGATIKSGKGTLNIASDNSSFKGNFYVQDGKLALNHRLGGNVIVTAEGILSGTGQVLGNLHAKDGGTVSPGNSLGVLQVNGNYVQSNSTYHAQIDSSGQSSLLNVHGTAILEGTSLVNVTSVDGGYNTKQHYQIIHADGGVQGQFAGVVANTKLRPSLSYDANNVYLDFLKSLTSIANTEERLIIAETLENGQPANSEIFSAIDGILALSDPDAQFVLDQLSAQQYTNILLNAELTSQQFIRRLYDPIRSIVSSNCRFVPNCGCCSCFCNCCNYGFPNSCAQTWIEAGAERSRFKRRDHIHGFNSKGYEITFGQQYQLDNIWTVGAAGSYQHDQIHYKLGGKGKAETFFGGLYGLYRPEQFYILSDLAFGYGRQKVKRHIDIGATRHVAKSKPNVFSSTLYVEAGLNFDCPCHLMVQPFVGIDLSYFRRSRIHEHGSSLFNMIVSRKSYRTAHSRLGVHLTTQGIRCFVVSVDFAWQYRIAGQGHSIHERFADFGNAFTISGARLRRSSFDGAINLTIPIRKHCELFVELSGQKWQRATTYSALAGVKIAW